jgi:hypothetical protein
VTLASHHCGCPRRRGGSCVILTLHFVLLLLPCVASGMACPPEGAWSYGVETACEDGVTGTLPNDCPDSWIRELPRTETVDSVKTALASGSCLNEFHLRTNPWA